MPFTLDIEKARLAMVAMASTGSVAVACGALGISEGDGQGRLRTSEVGPAKAGSE